MGGTAFFVVQIDRDGEENRIYYSCMLPYDLKKILDCRNGELDAMSSAFLKMAGVFSELELQMIRARVRSGMANAAIKGKHIGRPQTTKDDIPAVFYKHYPAFMAGTLNVSELARVCGLSRPTVYKYLRIVS